MDVCAPFVAHSQAPEAGQPGEGALDHPVVTAESLARVDAVVGDADPDAAAAQRGSAARV
jgi:hypothetical protein